MTTEQIEAAKNDIIDLYGEVTFDNVWDYAENYELDLTPAMCGLSDEF